MILNKKSFNRTVEHMLVKKYSVQRIAWFIFQQMGKSWYNSLIIAQTLKSEYKEELDA